MTDPDAKRPDGRTPPSWEHNSELSFKNVKEHLELAKDGVQDAVDEYKKEIARLSSFKNGFGKR